MRGTFYKSINYNCDFFQFSARTAPARLACETCYEMVNGSEGNEAVEGEAKTKAGGSWSDITLSPQMVQGINQVTESCVFKATLAGAAGSVMGLLMGTLFGGYSNAVDKAVEMEGSMGLKLKMGAKELGVSMRSYAKTLALFGFLYSGAECTVEKFRARHDIYNAVAAGCTSGALMASSPRIPIGPRARVTQMGIGCAGMAAFSAAIEYYMEYRE